ncbi:hypothetical protein PHYPSEUDO_007229 [Phytophthora pseudosyringae]|uniref:HTH CENPB-type domain-containing protein n=1 Tax=Phytophthora pseudosyringae TaxID=221518 RepID=A0A8T1VJQ3_9STRA|nr:hypothetical protein PHYPSEUDO_007229 [Phytophthora pseudosyringae]
MGPQRIPLHHTNRFRLRVAEAFVGRPHWESVRVFARNRGLSPSTVVSWAGRIDKLRETDRQGKSTLGGSGRKAETLEYEDLLAMRVKDLRRERYIVIRAMIIFMAQEIAPQFFEKKTVNAALCWCARFMARNRLTLRRVTTRGRESREDMFVRKAEFCDEVRWVLCFVLGLWLGIA